MPRIGTSWRSRLGVLSFLLVFLYSTLAPAEEMKVLPEWTRMKDCVATTEDTLDLHACYGFEEAKIVKKLDLDLHLKLEKCKECDVARFNLSEAVKKLSEAIVLKDGIEDRLKIRLKEKDQLLEKTTQNWLKAESRSVWKWLPWIIGGVVVVGAATFVGGWYVGSR